MEESSSDLHQARGLDQQPWAGRLSVNSAVLDEEARLHGTYLSRCSDDSLRPAGIAPRPQKQLLKVERGWWDRT